METLKNILAVAATFGLVCGAMACTELEEDCQADAGEVCEEGGGGAGGTEPEPGGQPEEGGVEVPDVVYDMVLIQDTSMEENTQGTPGVDICGVEVICDGESISGEDVTPYYQPGRGEVCGRDMSEVCTTGMARNNPMAGADDGAECDPTEPDTRYPGEMRSCYVSLGMSGELGVKFGRNLQGCSIQVKEHAGRQTETYTVTLCPSIGANDTLDSSTCIDPAIYTSATGGDSDILNVEARAEEGDEGEDGEDGEDGEEG